MTPSRRELCELRAIEPERAEDLGGVLAQGGRRAAQPTGGGGEARDHIVHRQVPHRVIGKVDDDLARDHMRVGHELVDVVDRCGGDLGALEDCHVFGERARRDKGGDRRLAGRGVADPVGVGAKR